MAVAIAPCVAILANILFSSDKSINRQWSCMEHRLKTLIESVPELMETAKVCRNIDLPNFYIAGGSITQLIWNSLLKREPLDKVKDFDIVYFDSSENKTEEYYETKIRAQLRHKMKIDIKNQASVHKWYQQKFGQAIPAYLRVEQGIDTWLSAFAIGFTLDANDDIYFYAPYGLQDAFNMDIKPNKMAMSESNYIKMTTSFKERWASISVQPW
jgi:hypothetical protein